MGYDWYNCWHQCCVSSWILVTDHCLSSSVVPTVISLFLWLKAVIRCRTYSYLTVLMTQGGYTLASHRGDTGWISDYFRWDSWWTRCHWRKFFGVSMPFINLPLIRNHLSPPHEVCDSPDQVAHSHIFGPKLGTSYLTRHLAGFGVQVSFCYPL
jgi:hypothetical protein